MFEGDLGQGPFILSYREPLSPLSAADQPSILQDLSGFPESVARLWVDEFLEDVRQGNFGSELELDEIALRIRTGIAQIAEAIPSVVGGVEEATALVEKLRAQADRLAAIWSPKPAEES